MDECPKCGDKREELINITDSISFECGTDFYPDRNNLVTEGYRCLQRRLTQQADLLRQALGAIIELIEWVRLDMIEMQREGHIVSHLATACDKAQSLIPALKKAWEKVK